MDLKALPVSREGPRGNPRRTNIPFNESNISQYVQFLSKNNLQPRKPPGVVGVYDHKQDPYQRRTASANFFKNMKNEQSNQRQRVSNTTSAQSKTFYQQSSLSSKKQLDPFRSGDIRVQGQKTLLKTSLNQQLIEKMAKASDFKGETQQFEKQEPYFDVDFSQRKSILEQLKAHDPSRYEIINVVAKKLDQEKISQERLLRLALKEQSLQSSNATLRGKTAMMSLSESKSALSNSINKRISMKNIYNAQTSELKRNESGSPYQSHLVIENQQSAYKDSEREVDLKQVNKTAEVTIDKGCQNDFQEDSKDKKTLSKACLNVRSEQSLTSNKEQVTEFGKNFKNHTLNDINFKTENESYTENSLVDKINENLATSIEDQRLIASAQSSATPGISSLEPNSAKGMTSKIKNLVVMAPGSRVDQEKTKQSQMTSLVYVGSALQKNKPKSNQRKRGILLIDKPITRRIKITKGRSSQDFFQNRDSQNSHYVNTQIEMADQSQSRTESIEIEDHEQNQDEVANIFVKTIGCEFDIKQEDTGDEETKTFQKSTFSEQQKEQKQTIQKQERYPTQEPVKEKKQQLSMQKVNVNENPMKQAIVKNQSTTQASPPKVPQNPYFEKIIDKAEQVLRLSQALSTPPKGMTNLKGSTGSLASGQTLNHHISESDKRNIDNFQRLRRSQQSFTQYATQGLQNKFEDLNCVQHGGSTLYKNLQLLQLQQMKDISSQPHLKDLFKQSQNQNISRQSHSKSSQNSRTNKFLEGDKRKPNQNNLRATIQIRKMESLRRMEDRGVDGKNMSIVKKQNGVRRRNQSIVSIGSVDPPKKYSKKVIQKHLQQQSSQQKKYPASVSPEREFKALKLSSFDSNEVKAMPMAQNTLSRDKNSGRVHLKINTIGESNTEKTRTKNASACNSKINELNYIIVDGGEMKVEEKLDDVKSPEIRSVGDPAQSCKRSGSVVFSQKRFQVILDKNSTERQSQELRSPDIDIVRSQTQNIQIETSESVPKSPPLGAIGSKRSFGISGSRAGISQRKMTDLSPANNSLNIIDEKESLNSMNKYPNISKIITDTNKLEEYSDDPQFQREHLKTVTDMKLTDGEKVKIMQPKVDDELDPMVLQVKSLASDEQNKNLNSIKTDAVKVADKTPATLIHQTTSSVDSPFKLGPDVNQDPSHERSSINQNFKISTSIGGQNQINAQDFKQHQGRGFTDKNNSAASIYGINALKQHSEILSNPLGAYVQNRGSSQLSQSESMMNLPAKMNMSQHKQIHNQSTDSFMPITNRLPKEAKNPDEPYTFTYQQQFKSQFKMKQQKNRKQFKRSQQPPPDPTSGVLNLGVAPAINKSNQQLEKPEKGIKILGQRKKFVSSQVDHAYYQKKMGSVSVNNLPDISGSTTKYSKSGVAVQNGAWRQANFVHFQNVVEASSGLQSRQKTAPQGQRAGMSHFNTQSGNFLGQNERKRVEEPVYSNMMSMNEAQQRLKLQMSSSLGQNWNQTSGSASNFEETQLNDSIQRSMMDAYQQSASLISNHNNIAVLEQNKPSMTQTIPKKVFLKNQSFMKQQQHRHQKKRPTTMMVSQRQNKAISTLNKTQASNFNQIQIDMLPHHKNPEDNFHQSALKTGDGFDQWSQDSLKHWAYDSQEFRNFQKGNNASQLIQKIQPYSSQSFQQHQKHFQQNQSLTTLQKLQLKYQFQEQQIKRIQEIQSIHRIEQLQEKTKYYQNQIKLQAQIGEEYKSTGRYQTTKMTERPEL